MLKRSIQNISTGQLASLTGKRVGVDWGKSQVRVRLGPMYRKKHIHQAWEHACIMDISPPLIFTLALARHTKTGRPQYYLITSNFWKYSGMYLLVPKWYTPIKAFPRDHCWNYYLLLMLDFFTFAMAIIHFCTSGISPIIIFIFKHQLRIFKLQL